MTDLHIPIFLDKSGANAVSITIGPIDLYFSYKTVIAFRAPGFGLVISANRWSSTTGRHLNEICRKEDKTRLSQGDFEKKLIEMLISFRLLGE